MASLELKLNPCQQPAAVIRLVHARGLREQSILSFRAVIDGSFSHVRLKSGSNLEGREGVVTVERGVKFSTERGVQHVGFVNSPDSFWGERLTPEVDAAFQVYVYLCDETFDCFAEWARLNKLPGVDLQVLANEGWTEESAKRLIWDDVSYKTSKLEVVRLDFCF
jgi:hypothetical protein